MITVTRSTTSHAKELAAAKQALSRLINDECRTVRALFVTDLPGQEMIYLQKEAEAAAFVADPDPELTDYPFIAAEVGATAPTAYEVAQVYLNLAVQWRMIGAGLEQVRLGALGATEAATSKLELSGVQSMFASSLEAFKAQLT